MQRDFKYQKKDDTQPENIALTVLSLEMVWMVRYSASCDSSP